MKYTFRPHRGAYEDAAEERFEFEDFQEFMDKLVALLGFRPQEFRSTYYCEDDRMTPSETYIVIGTWPKGTRAPFGFCSVEVNWVSRLPTRVSPGSPDAAPR